MSARPVLPGDGVDRQAIAERLDQTLSVEAGAGTGKTTALVKRIVALVASGVSIDNIAAITFTRAAASELRDRIRVALERLAGEETSAAGRAAEALERIDFAAFQTIDSFALSLLRERPLQAGLPPVLTPVDEVQAELAFQERWHAWLDDALDNGPFADAVSQAVRLGLGSPIDQLATVAQSFRQNRDLIEGVDFGRPGTVPRSAARILVSSVPLLEDLLRHCPGGGDRLEPHVRAVLALCADLREVGPDSDEALTMLAHWPSVSTTVGRSPEWGTTSSGQNACTEIKAHLKDLEELRQRELSAARTAVLGPLLNAIAGFVLDHAGERRRLGTVEFSDTLIWAGELLNDKEAHDHFSNRFTRLLIDEFQDTDPLQVELAARLATLADGSLGAGRLFVVGDPKQSIYRFRRADVAVLSAVIDRMACRALFLTQNFRSHGGIIDWVNHLFERWMGDGADPQQARYVSLEAAVKRLDDSTGVRFMGGPRDVRYVGDVRQEEVQDIARIAREIGAGHWKVRDEENNGTLRSSRYADLCILMPRRTGLALLEAELEEQGIPYTLEGQALVFNSQEVRDLLNCLSAIDDPSDQVAIVAALRSPPFGCSDPDLWRWRSAGRPLDYLAPYGPATGPVASAFAVLARFHAMRTAVSTAELIELFVRDRRLRELAFASHLRRERWRLIQLLIEQARALADSGPPSLREFVAWARERQDSDVRMPDSGGDLSENAVRIMTVHAAKGLEFPITLLTGLNAEKRTATERVLYDRLNRRVAVRLGSQWARFESQGFEVLRDQERLADEYENVRLMYVAATRARDQLIVSLYHKEAKSPSCAAAEILDLMEGAGQLWAEWTPLDPAAPESDGTPKPAAVTVDAASRAAWIEERRALLEHARRPGSVSATSLGTHDRPRMPPAQPTADDDLPGGSEDAPWRIGRGASSIGRAVHAVLQDIDPSTLAGLDGLVERHCAGESVPERAGEVLQLAEAVMSSPVVRRAVESGRYWREVYVGSPLDDERAWPGETDGSGILEGFIDLIFEDAASLVIVDYKTDSVPDDRSLESAAAPYRAQLGAYVAAAERTTGRPVSEAWIIFARRAAAGKGGEYQLPDPGRAAEEAVALARAAVSAAG